MVTTVLTRARRSNAALALDPLPASKVQFDPLEIAELDKHKRLKHYSHIRMEAKRRAVAALLSKAKQSETNAGDVEGSDTETSRSLGNRTCKIADAG